MKFCSLAAYLLPASLIEHKRDRIGRSLRDDLPDAGVRRGFMARYLENAKKGVFRDELVGSRIPHCGGSIEETHALNRDDVLAEAFRDGGMRRRIFNPGAPEANHLFSRRGNFPEKLFLQPAFRLGKKFCARRRARRDGGGHLGRISLKEELAPRAFGILDPYAAAHAGSLLFEDKRLLILFGCSDSAAPSRLDLIETASLRFPYVARRDDKQSEDHANCRDP